MPGPDSGHIFVRDSFPGTGIFSAKWHVGRLKFNHDLFSFLVENLSHLMVIVKKSDFVVSCQNR